MADILRTRMVLASIPSVGYTGIWWSVPIGWALADVVGVCYGRSRLLKAAEKVAVSV